MSFNYWYRNTACKCAIQDHLVIIIFIILFSIKRDLLVSGRETYRHFSHSKQMQAQWVSHPCHTQHLNAGRLCHSALLWPKVLTVWYDSSTQSVRKKKKNNPVKQLPFWTDEVDYQDLVVLDTKPLKVSFKDFYRHLLTYMHTKTLRVWLWTLPTCFFMLSLSSLIVSKLDLSLRFSLLLWRRASCSWLTSCWYFWPHSTHTQLTVPSHQQQRKWDKLIH